MEDKRDMEYELDIEKELPDSPKWPKVPKILLLVSICFSIILIVGIIILAVLYSKELSKTEDKSEDKEPNPTDAPQPDPYSQIDTYSFFGNKYKNLPYDEGGKIINTFKKEGGENYIEAMGEINNGSDYEKNDRNIYDLYIPQYALDRINETNGIILWVHGGAWKKGTKEQVDLLCRIYSQQGYITATVGYTLLAEPYKDFNIFRILDEITACIKAIKTELGKRGFIKEKLKLAIGGYSAGGHLVLLYSYLIKQFNIIPIDLVINYVGPIGLYRKYFYQISSINNTLENIEEVPIIEQAIKDGKIIPLLGDLEILVYMNMFYGNKFTKEQLKEMLDEKGNIKEDNENYKKMFNFVKFGYVTEIKDNHPSLSTICIYGGTDETLGVSTYAYLKEKADKDGRKLDFFYSRYEGHHLIIPSTEEGKQKLHEISSFTMNKLEKLFGY